MDEVCANCECVLNEDCCGGTGPFQLDGIDYCCQECAEDGECLCGCLAAPAATGPGQGDAAQQQGPIF